MSTSGPHLTSKVAAGTIDSLEHEVAEYEHHLNYFLAEIRPKI